MDDGGGPRGRAVRVRGADDGGFLPPVVRVPAGAPRAIDALPFADSDARGHAVLFHTGWDRNWRTDAYASGHPHLTKALAEQLVAAGVALVGIDSFNIDATDTGERPVHTALLAARIPIAEHLTNLAAVPERGGRFFAVPAPVAGMGTFPVRAFVIPS
jgi:kynurenine formamidase